MATDPKKTERIGLVLSVEELKEIDDWSWDQRIRSRSEAIRRLIRVGLDAVQSKQSPEA